MMPQQERHQLIYLSMKSWKQAQHCLSCYGVSLFDQDSEQLHYVRTLKKIFSKLLSKRRSRCASIPLVRQPKYGRIDFITIQDISFGLIQ